MHRYNSIINLVLTHRQYTALKKGAGSYKHRNQGALGAHPPPSSPHPPNFHLYDMPLVSQVIISIALAMSTGLESAVHSMAIPFL